MKTILLFLSLNFAPVTITTDKAIYENVSIFQAEDIVYSYIGEAFIEYKDHSFSFYCTDEGYEYNGEFFYTFKEMLKYSKVTKNEFKKCLGKDFSDTNCEYCFSKFYTEN